MLKFVLGLLLAACAWAQPGPPQLFVYTATSPSGNACIAGSSVNQIYVVTGVIYVCEAASLGAAGTYTASGGGGGSGCITSGTNVQRGDGSGGCVATGITSTTAGFLDPTSSVQTQLNAKAPLASPALTGNPTAPTQSASDNSTKLATTAYVTTGIANAIAAVNPAVAVQAATAAVLPNSPTYNNGASGIGATLTTAALNSTLVVDGYTPALNDRILVKNQASALQNGVYTVTQLATVGLAWILTRAVDYDQPSDMNNTGAIPVVNGTANASTQWVLTSTVNTVGTDAVTFAQFSIAPSNIATLSGTNAFTGSNSFTGGLSTGSSPPSLTAGTGGADAYGEGTVPSVCAAAGVDCVYASSAQHGLLASFNNGSYLPLVQGPASSTNAHCAQFSGTSGGLLADSGAACGGGVSAFDATQINLIDEFNNGHGSNNEYTIGDLGWEISGSGGGGGTTVDAATTGMLGAIALSTGSTGGAEGYVFLGSLGAGTNAYIPLNTLANWEMQAIVRGPSTASNETIHVGFFDANSTAVGGNFIGFEYDPANSSDWQGLQCTAATCTRTDTTVAFAAANTFKLSARATTAGTIRYRVSTNGGAFSSDVTSTSNLPTTALSPEFYIKTNTTTDRRLYIDRWAFQVTGLSR